MRGHELSSGGWQLKKSDIVSHVASRVSLSRGEANAAVTAVFEATQDSVATEQSVARGGFGMFSTKSPPARTGRNPRTGERIAIGASKTPSSKAGQTLRHTVRFPSVRRLINPDAHVEAVCRSHDC